MNPFLNLSVALALATLEVRAITQGRVDIVARLKELGPNGDVPAEHADEFDGLVKRCDEIDSHLKERKAIQKRSGDLARLGTPGQPEQRAIPRGPEPTPSHDPVADPEGNGQEYSLMRAVDLVQRNQPLDGYEGEISKEIERRSGKTATSFFMPWNLHMRSLSGRNIERRDVTSSGAAGLIPTIKGAGMIDILRARMLMSRLGATVLTDMVGAFELPKKTAGSGAYWVTEGSDITESSPTVGQVPFAPSTVGAFVDITRKLLKQSSRDAEMLMRQDMTDTIQVELDRVGFNGSGSGAEPEGILQNSDVPTVAIGDDGGAMTWAKIVEMETAVSVANADIGTLAYVTSGQGRGHLKITPKVAGQPVMLWNADGVNGYPAFSSQQFPADLDKGEADGTLTAAIFGNFADVVYALWGAIDVNVDTATLSKSGGVRLVLLADADVQLRRAESFSKCVDILHGYSAA